jgi:YidC/Oxa1 family membrane protein insertase
MLPKENRLKKEKEFEAVFKGGRTIRGKSVFLRYLINGTNKTRIGFIVSKKISKLSVERNKVKRRMRDIVRLRKDSLKEGLSIVVVSLPSIKAMEYREMKEDLEKILSKEELIKKTTVNIFSLIFNSILYQPMLNFLILIYIYTNNFGIAVIGLTLLIKFLTNPLNQKALESQKAMAEIQPMLKEIQRKHKDNQEKQAQEMMALYKDKKFNPFSGILLLFIQIPVIWALFYVFKEGINIDPSQMYSFITFPQTINPYFLGIDLSKPNIYLAVVTAIAQFIQAKTGTPPTTVKGEADDKTAQITNMMQKQMIIFIPLITLFVLYNLPAALGLYLLITTILTIFQQRSIFNKKEI